MRESLLLSESNQIKGGGEKSLAPVCAKVYGERARTLIYR